MPASDGRSPLIGRIALTAALLLLPFGCTAGLGVLFLSQAGHDRGPVLPAELGDPARVPDDSYVVTTVTPSLAAAEQWPGDASGKSIPVTGGGAVYDLREAPDVLAYCQSLECDGWAAGTAVVASGHLCPSSGAWTTCSFPELDEFVRTEAARRGVPPERLRVLVVGETALGPRLSMIGAFSISGLLLLLGVGLVLVMSRQMTRARSTPPRIVEEHVVALPISGVELRSRLERLGAQDQLRWEERGAASAVFRQGRSEMQVRVWGLWRAEQAPRRVRVDWQDAQYRGTTLRIRLEEDAGWLPVVGGRLEPLLRGGFARTLQMLRGAIDPP